MRPLWKTGCRFLKKLKMNLSSDPAFPLLIIYPEESKTLIQKDICTPLLSAVLFIIAKTRQPLKFPSAEEWIKKMWYILVYTTEHYSAIKQNEILPSATPQVDLEGIMLSNICQTEKDTYHMISLIYETLQTKQMNKWPWPGGSVVWSLIHSLKGCGFDPRSGRVQEAAC